MTFSITAHSYFVIIYERNLSEYLRNLFKQQDANQGSPLISKMELFVTIINGFYQILIVSYKSIIDVAGALYLP